MELDWTTFLLEVINFLILVWLLKRFLYQPVLAVIETRRQRISDELAQADRTQKDAQALKEQYEARLVDWEQEKRGVRDVLEQELVQERSQRIEQIEDELEQQRLKHKTRDQQQQAQWRSAAETEALRLGSSFTSQLLKKLSGPDLDQRLQQLFIDELAALPESTLEMLREEWQGGSVDINVSSAIPLDSERQQVIRQTLERKLGRAEGLWHFNLDESLIAGLRISSGGWMLQANLQDELHFFSEAAAHGG